MFSRLSTRAPYALKAAPRARRAFATTRANASSGADEGGPSFLLTEEQVAFRELTRNFTVRHLFRFVKPPNHTGS